MPRQTTADTGCQTVNCKMANATSREWRNKKTMNMLFRSEERDRDRDKSEQKRAKSERRQQLRLATGAGQPKGNQHVLRSTRQRESDSAHNRAARLSKSSRHVN